MTSSPTPSAPRRGPSSLRRPVRPPVRPPVRRLARLARSAPLLPRTRALVIVVAFALALASTGCGSTGSSAASGASGTAASGSASDLRFTMVEWSVSPKTPTVTAGHHTLTVVNHGAVVHSILILTGTDLSNLPSRSDGGIDEAALGSRVVGHLDLVAPGHTASTSIDLPAGDYGVVCNMAGMAAKAAEPNDMHTTMTVTA